MKKRILSIAVKKSSIGHYENNALEFKVYWESLSGWSKGTETHTLPDDLPFKWNICKNLNDLYNLILENTYE
jgi:hypothetical protein